MIIFQVTIDALLAAFMAYQAALKAGSQSATDMVRALYGAATTEHTSQWELGGAMAASALTGSVGAIVTPVVAVAVEEGHFASAQSQTQSAT